MFPKNRQNAQTKRKMISVFGKVAPLQLVILIKRVPLQVFLRDFASILIFLSMEASQSINS